jgi:hypothetical protein
MDPKLNAGSKPDHARPPRVERKLVIGSVEIKIMTFLELVSRDIFKNHHAGKAALENAGQFLFRLEFILVVYQRFPCRFFHEGITAQNAVASEPLLHIEEKLRGFFQCEMLDGSIPDDIVENPFRHIVTDIYAAVFDIRRAEIRLRMGNSFRIEISGDHRRGPARKEMMRKKSAAAAEIQDTATVFHRQHAEDAALPAHWIPRDRPKPILEDQVIVPLRSGMNGPLSLELKLMTKANETAHHPVEGFDRRNQVPFPDKLGHLQGHEELPFQSDGELERGSQDAPNSAIEFDSGMLPQFG